MSKNIQFDNGLIVINNSSNEQQYVYDINQILENQNIIKEILHSIGRIYNCVEQNTLKFSNFTIEVYEDKIKCFEDSESREWPISDLESLDKITKFFDYITSNIN